jgi:hypothetical protein
MCHLQYPALQWSGIPVRLCGLRWLCLTDFRLAQVEFEQLPLLMGSEEGKIFKYILESPAKKLAFKFANRKYV